MNRPIALNKIDPNPDQPRKTFGAAELADLASSIRQEGLIQPIIVRPVKGERFEIIAGERRYRAHKLLCEQGHKRFTRIACIVRKTSELQRDIAAIIENLQRVDIEPMQEATAFQRLVVGGLDEERIAKRLGIAIFRVRWRLQLLNLTPAITKLFEAGQIDQQAANELSRLPHDEQERVLRLVNRGQLVGWKSIRNAVDAILGGTTQADIFGDIAPKPSEQDVRTLSTMEARIETVAKMVGDGWRNGECIIAAKVNLDRANLMAGKLTEIQKALRVMERELRNTAAQGQIVLEKDTS